MKVLLLSPHAERLLPTLERYGDEDTEYTVDAHWVVSFGWREILSPGFLEGWPNRIINIHISVLPHNRGADPNFWSWFDNTPKGVTIHQITKGVDTGPILAQHIVPLSNAHTLRSSYEVLMREAVALFDTHWGEIRAGKPGVKQEGKGSYHRSADKDPWIKAHGEAIWDVACSEVERMGSASASH